MFEGSLTSFSKNYLKLVIYSSFGSVFLIYNYFQILFLKTSTF